MKPSIKMLYDFFAEYVEERGNDRFIFNEKISYTVSQTFKIVKSLAMQLLHNGIKCGDMVAVKAERTVETILVFYALQFIGGIAVMYDPREEIKETVKIIKNRLYVENAAVDLLFTEDCNEVCGLCTDSRLTSAVIFTSGSTGGCKPVKLSQYNFINNSLDTKDIGGYCKDDINICIVPVHHVFGLALIMTAVVTKHSILVPRAIDTEYILDCMEKYKVTRLNGVPGMYLALAEKRGHRKLKLNCGLIGGGPCTKEQFLKIERELGITLIPVYGMSECIGISCGSYTDSVDDRYDSVGRVYSMNTLKIEADGEIIVKSPAMSLHYVDSEGWLHTGDLGYMDGEGFLHINGRKKDIIIRNGNNLSAVEIERKILSLPQVKNVCVVGIPDEKAGEVPCALIVGDPVDFTGVLTKIEFPAKVIYSKEIPLTSSGKPDKQAIKQLFRLN